ncbi:hypothetical protein EYF80_024146 [Liparis tanakae]|uniref:Uncharacterized protein n=1 Tax=Liparis tanakae TaxID=230148 RepID=A0A4Z2HIL5_9TELE|nr:hypothetical protein EYF80_024146 [Liparis tanakae]
MGASQETQPDAPRHRKHECSIPPAQRDVEPTTFCLLNLLEGWRGNLSLSLSLSLCGSEVNLDPNSHGGRELPRLESRSRHRANIKTRRD